jgi:hypothetical protein
VGIGIDPEFAVKWVGSVRFQLESRVFLEVDEVLYISEMKIKFL